MTRESLIRLRDRCRLCGGPLGEPVIAFESLPVAGVYLSPGSPEADPCFSLSVCRCPACGHTQLRESLAPAFYQSYAFVGSGAAGYRGHLSWVAGFTADRLGMNRPRVLEIGASDGALLDLLRARGCETGGFEPAASAADRARVRGLAVTGAYFGSDAAATTPLRSPDVIIVRHVLEHIDDFAPLFAGLRALRQAHTRLIVEVPDLVSTVRAGISSNFYHPHPNYFDDLHLTQLLARHGWQVFHREIVAIFGGSLFVAAVPEGAAPPFSSGPLPAPSLPEGDLLQFVRAWRESCQRTRIFFDDLSRQGLTMDGYGAAERTIATLGMCGLGRRHIRRLVDRNPAFQGRETPGSRIPILAPEALREDPPDALVIFAQSHEAEIAGELAGPGWPAMRLISMRSSPPRFLEVETPR